MTDLKVVRPVVRVTWGYAWEKQEPKRVQHLEELRWAWDNNPGEVNIKGSIVLLGSGIEAKGNIVLNFRGYIAFAKGKYKTWMIRKIVNFRLRKPRN